MRLIASFSLLFVGSVLALVLNWARIGQAEGQAWSLVHQCPVCFDVSKLLSPVMAVDRASKLALHMVSAAFVLSLVAMTLVLFNKPKAYVERVLGVGGAVLALAPLVFSVSIPNEFPVFLERGSYAAMAFGTLTAVGAFVGNARQQPNTQQASQEDIREELAEVMEEGKKLVGSPRMSTNHGHAANPTPAAAYGATSSSAV